MKIFQKAGKLCALLLLPVLFAAAMLPAQAEGYSGAAVIPVEVAVTGSSIPSDAEYQVTLEAVTEGAPMPGESVLTMYGASERQFGPITYTVPGDYVYRVTQKAMGHDRCTYDAAVYQVTVRVTNAEAGGLATEIWAVKDNGTEKTDAVRFENSYRGTGGSGSSGGSSGGSTTATAVSQSSTVTSPKTGDNANLMLWVCLAGIALAALVLAASYYSRRKGQEANAEKR